MHSYFWGTIFKNIFILGNCKFILKYKKQSNEIPSTQNLASTISIHDQSCVLYITTHILNTTRLLESNPKYQIISSLYTSVYISTRLELFFHNYYITFKDELYSLTIIKYLVSRKHILYVNTDISIFIGTYMYTWEYICIPNFLYNVAHRNDYTPIACCNKWKRVIAVCFQIKAFHMGI